MSSASSERHLQVSLHLVYGGDGDEETGGAGVEVPAGKISGRASKGSDAEHLLIPLPGKGYLGERAGSATGSNDYISSVDDDEIASKPYPGGDGDVNIRIGILVSFFRENTYGLTVEGAGPLSLSRAQPQNHTALGCTEGCWDR